MTLQEWLAQKFAEWEHTQPGRSSYYQFAHYLDVNHTDLAQWSNGISNPSGEDIARLASKLGQDIYAVLGITPPSGQLQDLVSAFEKLPAALRERLSSAALEAGQQISSQNLDPESSEAKRLAVKVFERWGFRITG